MMKDCANFSKAVQGGGVTSNRAHSFSTLSACWVKIWLKTRLCVCLHYAQKSADEFVTIFYSSPSFSPSPLPLPLPPFSVGHAMCSIAACTSFPEPFLTPPGQKRLSFNHKKFAGQRASDHLAMLNAFYQWERTR